MSAVWAIVHELCPRCREGRIFQKPLFRGWLTVNEHCAVCGLKFEREQGYFVGAMYVSYALSILPALSLILLFWRIVGLASASSLFAAAAAYLPSAPYMTRLSRVIWIHIDQRFDPE